MSYPTLDDIAEWAESNGCVTGLAGAPSEECVAHVGLRLLHAYILAACKSTRKKALEDAALACEHLGRSILESQSGDIKSLENVMLRQVAELGAGECAIAIRAGASKEVAV